MKPNQITFRHSILINRPADFVWDYTQNYNNRTKWDSSVIDATVLQTTPNRVVKLKMKGNTSMTFVYKLDDRPNKTTLAVKESISPFIVGGGGSWTYEEQDDGQTRWTQSGSIIFKNNILSKLFMPVYKLAFSMQTKKAMKKAKSIMEKQ